MEPGRCYILCGTGCRIPFSGSQPTCHNFRRLVVTRINMMRVIYFILLLLCTPSLVVCIDDEDEGGTPDLEALLSGMGASSSTEPPYLTLLRTMVEEENKNIAIHRADVEEAAQTIELHSAPEYDISDEMLIAERNALEVARNRLNDAMNRAATARNNYANGLAEQDRVAREERRRAEDRDKHGKRPADDDNKDNTSSKFLKRDLPVPRDGWKDSKGKTHVRHESIASFLTFVYYILWCCLDVIANDGSFAANPSSVSLARATKKEELSPEDTPINSFLEAGLREVYEFAHDLYLRHTKGNKVADYFSGDPLIGADRSKPILDRFLAATKHAEKLGSESKKSGFPSGRRGGSNHHGNRAPHTRAPAPPHHQPPPGGRPMGPCHVCGAMGHFARDCPNRGNNGNRG